MKKKTKNNGNKQREMKNKYFTLCNCKWRYQYQYCLKYKITQQTKNKSVQSQVKCNEPLKSRRNEELTEERIYRRN